MKVPSWLGVIRQTAFVVDDIEREANHWVNFNGIGPWFLYNVDIADTTYRGETVRMKARMGLAQSGTQQIELIEPSPEPLFTLSSSTQTVEESTMYVIGLKLLQRENISNR